MLLFAWITFICLTILLTHDIIVGIEHDILFTMFYVGIFSLGIILGYTAALRYMIATGIVFFALGAILLNIRIMIVPVVLAYGFTIPAKVVERFIKQSTHDLAEINQRLEDLVAARTAELSESNQQLREEVGERAHIEETLRQRTRDLQSRNEELNAYAHTVAHDIKSPLASIIGFGELLERHFTQFTEEKLTYYFGIIARNGRKITNIVDELLLFSSVRELDEVESTPLDMASIVNEAMTRLSHIIVDQPLEIIVPEVWPAALGYAPWVEEMWTNYISNAIKYGGVPPCVELGASAGNNAHIRFWVRDNGPGLTPEEQVRLFTPYTRLDLVRARGHGLGLSIVRRIAERLNGEVGVESEIGQGSTFFFTLPAAQMPIADAQPEPD